MRPAPSIYGLEVKHIIFLMVSFFYSATMSPQTIRCDRLTIQEGLSQSEVLCILQDSYGYMWMGTQDGLNKYDGHSIKVYKYRSEDPSSLSNNWVWGLFEDSHQQLWVGTREGLNRYDRSSDRFVRYFTDVGAAPGNISGNVPVAFTEDSKGTLWVGCWRGGLNRYDRQNDSFTSFCHDPNDPTSLSSDLVRSLYVDSRDRLWVGTWEGLNLYIPEKNNFQRYYKDTHGLSGNEIFVMTEGANGHLWVGTFRNGLSYLELGGQHFIPHEGVGNTSVRDLLSASDGSLWAALAGDGLWRLSLEKKSFEPVQISSTGSQENSNQSVYSLEQDHTGNIWIGGNYGVDIYYPIKGNFNHFQHNASNINTLSDNAVWGFAEDSLARIWIATAHGGVNVYDTRIKAFENFDSSSRNNGLAFPDHINHIITDRRGKIWMATSSNGLYSYDVHDDTLENYREALDNEHTKGLDNLNVLLYDHPYLWIGTIEEGLIRFDTLEEEYLRFQSNPKDNASLPFNYILSMSMDSKKHLWIGAWGGGLAMRPPDSERFVHIGVDEDDPKKLSNGLVNCIFEDSEGSIWIGTNLGLNKLVGDPLSHKYCFEKFYEQDGLPNNAVYSVLEGNDGHLWVSTNYGLSKFDPKQRTFENFTKEDGLQSNEFNGRAALRTREGRLLFGGVNGFNFFHPDSIRTNPHPPPIALNSFKVFDQQYPLLRSFGQPSSVVLSYDQNFFSFEYAALDYANPSENQYAYRMKGFDKDWVQAGNRRYASYTNLDPGEYVFEVKGANSDGVWNETPVAVEIIITPPIWRTWWAYLLYMLVFTGLLLLLVRAFVIRERWKARLRLDEIEIEKAQEIGEMKSRFFTNISHEFRTPLTLVSGIVNNFLEQGGDPGQRKELEVLQRNSQRLKHLIDQLLDLSMLEANKLNLLKSETLLFDLIRASCTSFLPMAQGKDIQYNVNVPSRRLNVYIDSEKLEMMVYNLLSNALKFTPQGGHVVAMASILKKEEDIWLQFTVSDSGPGLNKEELSKVFDRFYRSDDSLHIEGTGIGLSFVKELTELMGGTISAESTEGEGATFRLLLPLELIEVSPEDILEPTPKPGGRHVPISQERGRHNRSHRLLVVEDNEDMRHYLKSILEEEGRLLEACNGEEALYIAQEEVPDVIISDLMMPIMAGDELCRRLKGDGQTSHIPFIMLTAKATLQDKISGLTQGADDYLYKPFSKDELRLKVRNILKRREQLQQQLRRGIMAQPTTQHNCSSEERFLAKLRELVLANLSDSDLDVASLSEKVGLSRSQLHRKVQALVGVPPSVLIREIRIHKAAQLLKGHWDSISQVAYEVGFNNLSYFTQCFKEVYHTTPSRFRDESLPQKDS